MERGSRNITIFHSFDLIKASFYYRKPGCLKLTVFEVELKRTIKFRDLSSDLSTHSKHKMLKTTLVVIYNPTTHNRDNVKTMPKSKSDK